MCLQMLKTYALSKKLHNILTRLIRNWLDCEVSLQKTTEQDSGSHQHSHRLPRTTKVDGYQLRHPRLVPVIAVLLDLSPELMKHVKINRRCFNLVVHLNNIFVATKTMKQYTIVSQLLHVIRVNN
ncbi:hypothetical protein HanPSC8_Chr06g0248721 [Helianthus annuus]|nr:hypothetical protein HanPSC8_Chr06g0248721 [Helianthus annuus]